MSEEQEKKRVIVNFENAEGKMQLKIKGKNSVENAIKIMTTFDEVCKEIRTKEKERETEISRTKEE